MKTKNIPVPKFFDLFVIINENLDAIELPAKLWNFIDSQDQPFDILDLAKYFQSDMPQARKVLDFLLNHKLCEASQAKPIRYQEWKEQNTRVPAEAKQISPATTNVTNNDDESIDITVAEQTKSIYLEIG